MTTTAGSQPTLLPTHIWCRPPLRATPPAIGSLGNSNLEPNNRCGGARGHPVRPFSFLYSPLSKPHEVG